VARQFATSLGSAQASQGHGGVAATSARIADTRLSADRGRAAESAGVPAPAAEVAYTLR
jgi:hypothetical protein